MDPTTGRKMPFVSPALRMSGSRESACLARSGVPTITTFWAGPSRIVKIGPYRSRHRFMNSIGRNIHCDVCTHPGACGPGGRPR